MTSEYFDGQMPENKKPDLQWMTSGRIAYRHLIDPAEMQTLCGEESLQSLKWQEDTRRRACPQCLSIALNNISSVTVAVVGGYDYLPEASEPMVERIPLERIPNPRVPKRPLLQNPHEEPQTYSLAQVLLIRDYLMPYMRTKSGYSSDPDEASLDMLLRAGAFDTDRVLILAAEAEQEKARKAAEREAAKRSPKTKNKNSLPAIDDDEAIDAMLDADAKG